MTRQERIVSMADANQRAIDRANCRGEAIARYITLTALDNRRVSLSSYVAAVRKAKENPALSFIHGLTTWDSSTGAQVVEQFREGVHDRINRHVPGYGEGRKWSAEYWSEMRVAQYHLNSRVIIRWLPRDLRKRFEDRIVGYDNDL